DEQLAKRVSFIHESLGTAAIVEQFIDGREMYVGVIGNERLDVFPVWEMNFKKMPEGVHRIATSKAKWSVKYQKKHGIDTAKAEDLPRAKADELQAIARRAFRALEMSGYARMDFRLDATGSCFVLEANANPHLAFGEGLAESAKVAGLEYPDLVQRILNLGLRWEPERAG